MKITLPTVLDFLFVGTWMMYTKQEAYFGKAIVLRGYLVFLWLFLLSCFAFFFQFPEKFTEIFNDREKLIGGISVGLLIVFLMIYGTVAIRFQTIKFRTSYLVLGTRAQLLGYFYCGGGIILTISLLKFLFA